MFQILAERRTNQAGFTLVEIMVVLGVSAILFALATINLGKVHQTASVSSLTDTLTSDIKGQQLLAMSGGIGSTTSQQPQGVHVQSGSYVLYAGSSYNGSDTNNFTVSISPAVIATTFPGSNLLFQKGDGAVSGFSGGSNTITISDNGTSKTISVGRYGALTIN